MFIFASEVPPEKHPQMEAQPRQHDASINTQEILTDNNQPDEGIACLLQQKNSYLL